jgi:hypothetical protein
VFDAVEIGVDVHGGDAPLVGPGSVHRPIVDRDEPTDDTEDDDKPSGRDGEDDDEDTDPKKKAKKAA